MKKMYNNPKTEAVLLNSEELMLTFGVLAGSDAPAGEGGDAPARGAYNPNGR